MSLALHARRIANLLGVRNMLLIMRHLWLLYLGANIRHLGGLPGRYNPHHLGEELAGGALRIHVTLDVLVDGDALLEQAHGVKVAADLVVGVVEGGRHAAVGVHEHAALGEGGGDGDLTALGAVVELLVLADNIARVFGLGGVEAGEVGEGRGGGEGGEEDCLFHFGGFDGAQMYFMWKCRVDGVEVVFDVNVRENLQL